jgi:hypothetical protein
MQAAADGIARFALRGAQSEDGARVRARRGAGQPAGAPAWQRTERTRGS